ncbi:MAG TPA: ABC transporter permease [Thermoanaerobaculia bacterium]
MLLKEIFAVALTAVRTNLFRSILTTLGIVIGVGSVITMVALGEGAQRAMEERLQAMGTNLLTVSPGNRGFGGVTRTDAQEMTSKDAKALEADCRSCVEVVPEMSRNLQVVYEGANTNSSIVGTTPNYPRVRNFELEYGRFFHAGEVEGRRRVAVLGYGVPALLGLAPQDAVGKQIRIKEMWFDVIGVFAEKGSSGFMNPDEQIVIPLDTAQFRLFGQDQLRFIAVQVESPTMMDRAMTEIERVMRRAHKIRPGKENDFSIRNQIDMLQTFQESQKIFRYLLLGIASVSLLVGGIGIMNIMMVSVTERTREIGVRKALGATRRAIMLQFLIEALVLCLLGGFLGIGLGALLSKIMASTLGWRLIITPESIAISFLFSAAVGLFFGIYPAGRASKLDPIEALRYE